MFSLSIDNVLITALAFALTAPVGAVEPDVVANRLPILRVTCPVLRSYWHGLTISGPYLEWWHHRAPHSRQPQA